MVARALDLSDWGATVRIAPAEPVALELAARRAAGAPARSVWVTDLADLRSAYWRSVARVEPSAERRGVMEAGRETHARVGPLLAPARLLEVRLHREGIVGQVDLLDDRPTELKTTTLPRDAANLRASRTSYVEQLGMYCALAGSRVGRLVLLDPTRGESPAVAVYDAHLASVEPVWEEMRRRAGLLRDALERRSPAGLPACPWRGHGCEFEGAAVCDCTGAEPKGEAAIASLVDPIVSNPELAHQLEARLASSWALGAPSVRRYRDLVYPRRAFFERTAVPAERTTSVPGEVRSADRIDLYRIVSDLLEAGPTGDTVRVPTPGGIPMESVACFRGDPMLLKISRAGRATPLDALLRNQPQYFLELGFRCAGLGRSNGWLFVGYERATEWNESVYAYRVSFDPLDVIDREFRARAERLAGALTAGRPDELPACPPWMVDGCPYRDVCGCGPEAAPARSNR